MSDDVVNKQRVQEEERQLRVLRSRLKIFEQYLTGEGVTEVAVNSPGGIQVMTRGRWEYHDDKIFTFDRLKEIGQQLANVKNAKWDETSCALSGYLPDGERVEMTHPPVCPENEIYVNIRKHSIFTIPHSAFIEQEYYGKVRHEMSLKLSDEERKRYEPHLTEQEGQLWELAKSGKWADFMEKSVDWRQNMVISGPTGTGKTAYMRGLCDLIPTDERLITVEDTPELPLLNHRNRNRLIYKKHADEKYGMLAKAVLHSVMRKTPDRVLMAELRGDEAMFYLSGVLLSGHPGGITTGHGNSPRDMFFRIALLIMSSQDGQSLDLQTTLMLLQLAINVITQLEFDHKTNRRRVSAIWYDPMYRLSLLG